MNYPRHISPLKGTIERAQKEAWIQWGMEDWLMAHEMQIRKHSEPSWWSRTKADLNYWLTGILP